MTTNATVGITAMLVQTLLDEPLPSAEEIATVVVEEVADHLRGLARAYEEEQDGICNLLAMGVRDAADWLTEDGEEGDSST